MEIKNDVDKLIERQKVYGPIRVTESPEDGSIPRKEYEIMKELLELHRRNNPTDPYEYLFAFDFEEESDKEEKEVSGVIEARL